MSVTLRRAWEICRLLDEVDEQTRHANAARAAVLSEPRPEPGTIEWEQREHERRSRVAREGALRRYAR